LLSSSLVTATYMKSTTRSSLLDASHMELFEQPEKSHSFPGPVKKKTGQRKTVKTSFKIALN